MREVSRDHLMVPGICVVCESAPQSRIVDTLQTLETPGPSPLNGRKYLCEGCVKAAAQCLELVSSEEFDKATARADSAEGRLRAVRDFFVSFTTTLEAQLDHAEVNAPVEVAARGREIEEAEVAEQEVIEGVDELGAVEVEEDEDAEPETDDAED